MNAYKSNINKYLWFGYIPPEKFPGWLDKCITQDSKGDFYNMDEAGKRIDILFNQLLQEKNNGQYVVPLSGGWDSRCILAALLERLDSKQITTISFGSNGQLDYELGSIIANVAGVRHEKVDLKELDFKWEELCASVRRAPWTSVPDEMFNYVSVSSVASDNDVVWSGFLGEALTGNHLVVNDSLTLEEHKKKFCEWQRRLKKTNVTKNGFYPEDHLPVLPANINLHMDDALDLGIRQTRCVAPIVLPIKSWEKWGADVGKTSYGKQVIAPFLDKKWAGYWLSAPRKVRRNQELFLETMRSKYPKLFSIPGKEDFGISDKYLFRRRVVKKIHKTKKRIQNKYPWLRIRTKIMLNYLDYDEMLRTRPDYEETMVHALDLLKNNYQIDWIDVDKLWSDHYARKTDHSKVLLVLLGLAANLTVNREQ